MYHYKKSKQEAYQKALELLELVGITDAAKKNEKLSTPVIWRYASAYRYCHCPIL